MSRILARETAVQMVFEYLFQNKKDEENFESLCEENKLIKNDIEFARAIYDGVVENFEELQEKIKSSIKDFSFSQVVKMDMAILLVAVYELTSTQTDRPIIINEALNLAKKFSTDKSSSFINGILSTFVKGL